MGFTRRGNKTIYREWAPGAKSAALIGDFNKWEPAWMERDEWGVWSIELPDGRWPVGCMSGWVSVGLLCEGLAGPCGHAC